MNNLWNNIKWIFNITRPFIKYLIIIIILGVVTSLIGISRAVISKHLIDSATSRQSKIMFQMAAIFAGTIVIELIIRALVTVVTSKCNIEISNGIQRKLFSRIVKTKWTEFRKYHSGDLLTRMTSDVDAVTSIITNTVPTLISLSVLLVGSFIAFMFLEPVLGIILIIISPVTVLLSKYFSSKLKKLYLKFQEIESRYRSFLNESIQNIVIIKTFCLEENNINNIRNIQKDRVALTLTRSKITAFANSIMVSGFWINYFLVFGWGAFKLYNNTSTFGSITAMISLIGNIQGPISGMAMLIPQVIAAIGSAERLRQLENLSSDSLEIEYGEMKTAGIVYENIDFSYKKENPILKDVSINIDAGDTVALIGASGQGKTTFIHLLLALIYPDKGHIFIKDANDKIDVSSATRKFISYVPQGNTLFSGTIRDNLLFGNFDATEEEIEEAVRNASAYEFIKKSPEGFDRILGERGAGVSEGQAQRLAIARALLHKKPILLLDEATSALDADTEIKVLEAIRNLKPRPTCIIITHRTTALGICNKVYKIKDNHVIEEKFSIIK
ncbi:ABC transporter ATP-binding protein [Clostridium pasteurianum]|uniref:ABC transporter ATP-binding protein n=1 Tax=Clostridium pasteurianum TaxID=1501 RepID=UPI002260908D|nr:ABC transporter ATP-binding protein [Clostridium pasteurianum]UZW14956.1 ABC transporter ATP-binding protein [Clostridium pasteurianum]